MRPLAGLIGLVVGSAWLLGCQPGANRPAEVDALRDILPILERHQVREFRNEDWCLVLRYVRGTFAETDSPETCLLTGGAAKAFDSQASADFDEMKRLMNGTTVDPSYVLIEYSSTGSIRSAVFETGCAGCSVGRYIYEPNGPSGSRVRGPDTSEVEIQADWFWYQEE